MVKTASNKTKSYIDFNNHSLNQEVVLSIEESGRTNFIGFWTATD